MVQPQALQAGIRQAAAGLLCPIKDRLPPEIMMSWMTLIIMRRSMATRLPPLPPAEDLKQGLRQEAEPEVIHRRFLLPRRLIPDRRAAGQAKKGKKRKLGFLLLLLLAAILAYGAWLFLHRPTGYWNVAVFGVDSRDGNTDRALADVQMICSIDRATGEIKLVSVYRDTYLKINSDGNYHKINEAYFKGGHKQAVDALEENLDIKIDDYATFNWSQWLRPSTFWAA